MNVADGVDHGVVELVDVVGDEVGQGRILGMAPECFDRIEVGRVGGQPFDVEPSRSSLVQSTHGRAVDVEPIQHHDQRPPILSVDRMKIPPSAYGLPRFEQHYKILGC